MGSFTVNPGAVSGATSELASATSSLNGINSEISAGISTIRSARGSEYLTIDPGAILEYPNTARNYVDQLVSQIEAKVAQVQSFQQQTSGVAGVLARGTATYAMVNLKAAEGIGSAVEQVVDGVASVTGMIAGIFSSGAKEKIGEFVKKDHVGDFFTNQYENGVFRDVAKYSYMSHDGTAANVIKGVGVAGGYIAMALATGGTSAAVSGGSIAAGAAAGAGSAAINAGLAVAGGIGSGTQAGLQSGKSYNEAFKVGLKSGAIQGGTVAAVGALGKISQKLPSSASKLAGSTSKTALSSKGSGTPAIATKKVASLTDDIIGNAQKATKTSGNVIGKTTYKEVGATATKKATSLTDDIIGNAKKITKSSKTSGVADVLDKNGNVIGKTTYKKVGATATKKATSMTDDIIGKAKKVTKSSKTSGVADVLDKNGKVIKTTNYKEIPVSAKTKASNSADDILGATKKATTKTTKKASGTTTTQGTKASGTTTTQGTKVSGTTKDPFASETHYTRASEFANTKYKVNDNLSYSVDTKGRITVFDSEGAHELTSENINKYRDVVDKLKSTGSGGDGRIYTNDHPYSYSDSMEEALKAKQEAIEYSKKAREAYANRTTGDIIKDSVKAKASDAKSAVSDILGKAKNKASNAKSTISGMAENAKNSTQITNGVTGTKASNSVDDILGATKKATTKTTKKASGTTTTQGTKVSGTTKDPFASETHYTRASEFANTKYKVNDNLSYSVDTKGRITVFDSEGAHELTSENINKYRDVVDKLKSTGSGGDGRIYTNDHPYSYSDSMEEALKAKQEAIEYSKKAREAYANRTTGDIIKDRVKAKASDTKSAVSDILGKAKNKASNAKSTISGMAENAKNSTQITNGVTEIGGKKVTTSTGHTIGDTIKIKASNAKSTASEILGKAKNGTKVTNGVTEVEGKVVKTSTSSMNPSLKDNIKSKASDILGKAKDNAKITNGVTEVGGKKVTTSTGHTITDTIKIKASNAKSTASDILGKAKNATKVTNGVTNINGKTVTTSTGHTILDSAKIAASNVKSNASNILGNATDKIAKASRYASNAANNFVTFADPVAIASMNTANVLSQKKTSDLFNDNNKATVSLNTTVPQGGTVSVNLQSTASDVLNSKDNGKNEKKSKETDKTTNSEPINATEYSSNNSVGGGSSSGGSSGGSSVASNSSTSNGKVNGGSTKPSTRSDKVKTPSKEIVSKPTPSKQPTTNQNTTPVDKTPNTNPTSNPNINKTPSTNPTPNTNSDVKVPTTSPSPIQNVENPIPTVDNKQPTITPVANNKTVAASNTNYGGGYTGSGNTYTIPDSIQAPIDNITDTVQGAVSSINGAVGDTVKKGNIYTKIPVSSEPLSSLSSSGSYVIPVAAGLGVATAAGIGAKAYLDKKNDEEEEESGEGVTDGIMTDSWNNEDIYDIDYDAGIEKEEYLDDDYGYQDDEKAVGRYDARSSDELIDLL